MKILLAEHHGFCYGVKRAITLAENCIGKEDTACTLGPIIHNPQLVEKLASRGVNAVKSLSEIENGTVIIRSHGVGPDIYQQAEEKGLKIVDATCPHVKKAQQSAYELGKEGYHVIVIGERNHPEVQSILKWSTQDAVVVETLDEARQLPFTDRVGAVAQTTFSGELFTEIVTELKKHCHEIKICRTICTATELRQSSAIALAKKVDLMLVVGGKNSANTTRLAQLCHDTGCQVKHIETSTELQTEDFININIVGITAGASTPEWIIEEVIKKMEEIEELMSKGLKKIERATIIKGTVVSVRKDEVFVDIGYKGEGVISLGELAYPVPESADEVVSVGDIIDVYVTEADGTSGILLSKVRADRELAWDKLQEAHMRKIPIEGKVLQVVKGGLKVSVMGIEAFLPASHADLKFVEDLSSFQDKNITAIPIELDLDKKRVIISRKVLLQEKRRKEEAEVFASLKVGQTVQGIVTRIVDFGAFVDIKNGIEGLIHISDLSWGKVRTPEEILSVGDLVSAMVLKLDEKSKRISLGLKQIQVDPWLQQVDVYKTGMNVNGKVSKLSSFGAFVTLDDGIEGLIHISELSEKRLSNAEEVLDLGQEVTVKILEVDKSNKRIALSLIQAQADAERVEFEPFLTSKEEFSHSLGDKLAALLKQKL